MAINRYRSTWGVFSIVVDDEILANIRSNFKSGRYIIFDSTGITEDGHKLIEIANTLDGVASIMWSGGAYNHTTYSNALSFVRELILMELSDVTSTTQTKYYSFSDAKQLVMSYRYFNSKPDLRVTNYIKVSDSQYPSTGVIRYPYGSFSTQTAGDLQSDYLSFDLMYSNETFTDFEYLSFTFVKENDGRVFISEPNDPNDVLVTFFDGLKPWDGDIDPYLEGGNTDTGGGTGDFDGTSDDIAIPDLPTLSATSANFITLFNPSLSELQNLANYMWSGFDLDSFRKLFANPMDCILGLSIVPVAVPDGGSKAVTVGNISTGVTMNVAASQYVTVDCGTLNVNEYWGAYLDYDPYTKAEIYLPYIGTHPIAVDDIMNKSVHVVYHVDILSGACNAYVQCGGSVLYTFIGQCSASIPITGNDWTNVINGVLSIAGSIGSMVATGGMTAPMQAAQKVGANLARIGAGASIGTNLASTAVNSFKPSVEKSGSVSGVGGMLAIQTPYLILTRPRQALPKKQNTYTGYPSFITSKLSALTGYTEIEEIHLDGLSATEVEVNEIDALLRSGVIL